MEVGYSTNGEEGGPIASIYKVGFRDLKEEEAAVFGTYYVRAKSETEAEEKVLRRTRGMVYETLNYSRGKYHQLKRQTLHKMAMMVRLI